MHVRQRRFEKGDIAVDRPVIIGAMAVGRVVGIERPDQREVLPVDPARIELGQFPDLFLGDQRFDPVVHGVLPLLSGRTLVGQGRRAMGRGRIIGRAILPSVQAGAKALSHGPDG